jgi:hypothetical protein
MKNYGLVSLLIVLVYTAMFLLGIFHESAIDPMERGSGRLLLFVVWLLLVFATGIFILEREDWEWYHHVSALLLVAIWLCILLAVVICQIDFFGPEFRF